jgi:hypothetical protein
MKRMNIFLGACLIFIIGNTQASLYLDLMKECLLNLIYEDAAYHGPFNVSLREQGRDWPSLAHTMIGIE